MYTQRARWIDRGLQLFDLLALTVAFVGAYWVRDSLLGERYVHRSGLYAFEFYSPILAVSLVAWTALSRYAHLYQARHLPSIGSEVRRLGLQTILVCATIAAVGFLTKRMDVSRLLICFYFVIAMALLVTNRVLVRRAFRAIYRLGYNVRIVAVVGTSEMARHMGEAIIARREWGYHLAGYIEAAEGGQPHVGPLLGSVAELDRMLGTNVLDEVVFAVPEMRLDEIQAAAVVCKRHGVTARICLDIPRRDTELSIEELEGLPVLGVY